jgi:hypothetical protein
MREAKTFQDARKALVDILENLSFVKVVSVQTKIVYNKPFYTGEAVEIHFRDTRERPKLVFFDKSGRSRMPFKVGPIQLIQAPLGHDHPASIPTAGDVLVGSLVPNGRKSHLDHVLRGWSSDAKPLWELLRLLKFGTKYTEFDARTLLIQNSATLLQTPKELKQLRDDIYMTARIILWATVRPLQVLASIQSPDRVKLKIAATDLEKEQAGLIRISSNALDFFDSLLVKVNDSAMSDAFSEGLEFLEAAGPVMKHDDELLKPYEPALYEPMSPTYAPQSPTYTPTFMPSLNTKGLALNDLVIVIFGPLLGLTGQVLYLNESSFTMVPLGPASTRMNCTECVELSFLEVQKIDSLNVEVVNGQVCSCISDVAVRSSPPPSPIYEET